jgi:hypothetical protein
MSRLVSIGWFVLAGLGLAIVEWVARRPDSRIPTLGDVFGALMRYRAGGVPVGRIVVLAACWWTGWHFLAR